ncbi:MAG: class I SAM-dependent methyltransferase [Candidatus Moranbacteria bacterium]|nr:class I SAM-dependent methyltransferase [Candidatus Moranbacteria bacterium]
MKNIFHLVLKSYFNGHSSYIAEVRCKNKKTLDMGCGFGSFLKYDKDNFTGIEINDIAIEYCKKNNFKVEKINANKIPFESESFDKVVALQVIEHLTIDDAYNMLTEAERILKKDGELILSTEMNTKTFWDTFSHVKPYPPKSILKMLLNDDTGLETFAKIKKLKPTEIYYSGKFYKNKMLSIISQLMANYFNIGRINYTIILKREH